MSEEREISLSVQAVQTLEPKLRAISEAEIKTRWMELEAATSAGLFMVSNSRNDLTKLEAVFKQSLVPEVELLELATRAVKGAAILAARTKLKRPDIEGANKIKSRHFTCLHGACVDYPELIERIKKIGKGKSHLKLGGTLISLASFELDNWDLIETKNFTTKERIAEIEDLGYQILEWVKVRDTKSKDHNLEHRAWTYMSKLYNKIRIYARVIYLEDKETWKQNYPALKGKKKSSPSKKDTKFPKDDQNKPISMPPA